MSDHTQNASVHCLALLLLLQKNSADSCFADIHPGGQSVGPEKLFYRFGVPRLHSRERLAGFFDVRQVSVPPLALHLIADGAAFTILVKKIIPVEGQSSLTDSAHCAQECHRLAL